MLANGCQAGYFTHMSEQYRDFFDQPISAEDYFGRSIPEAPTEPITKKNLEIPSDWLFPNRSNMSYTYQGRFTVFLAEKLKGADTEHEIDGLKYYDEDHLGVNYKKLQITYLTVERELGTKRTPRYYETVLQRALDQKELKLCQMIVGLNSETGKWYHIFGVEGVED
jgi:hypothetical protein